jgi:hypothetical protein
MLLHRDLSLADALQSVARLVSRPLVLSPPSPLPRAFPPGTPDPEYEHPAAPAEAQGDSALASTAHNFTLDFSRTSPLITGCGRSGTLSLTTYLSSLGIPAVHEKLRWSSVIVSWLYASPADFSGRQRWYPMEDPGTKRVRLAMIQRSNRGRIFDPVIHLVRHPLKVISSTHRCFCADGDKSSALGKQYDKKSWQFVDGVLASTRDLDLGSLRRSMLYWLDWNRMVQANATFRLEDVRPAQILGALGVLQPMDETAGGLGSRVPSDPDHESSTSVKSLAPDVTWQDLHATDQDVALAVFELAQFYGYERGRTWQDALV